MFVDTVKQNVMRCLLLASVITTDTGMANTCWKKVSQAQRILTEGSPDDKLSKYLCVYFKNPLTIRRAVIIMKLESDFKNVVSATNDDFGYFQFHVDTIKAYGLDKNYLIENLFYQFHSFERIMKDKLMICADKEVPEACWHSATPKHYTRYSNKYKEVSMAIGDLL